MIPNQVLSSEFFYMQVLNLSRTRSIFFFLFSMLHFNIKANSFSDLVSVDTLQSPYRYFLVYNIISHSYNTRIFPKVWLFLDGISQSITALFKNVSWYERESWDLMGIFYIGNVDLRRILNDYGFRGFPLRKDFPISGFTSIKYDTRLRSIRSIKLRMLQEFRTFSSVSPWTTFF